MRTASSSSPSHSLSVLLFATTVIQSLPLLVETTLLVESSPSSSPSASTALFRAESPASLEYFASSGGGGEEDEVSRDRDTGGGGGGAIVMYKHPKAQFYPRPQSNNYGYGRPNQQPFGYSYIGYINRQARRYPVMMYTLTQCIPCQRAKHLLATTYGDVPSHFLELAGHEDWQRQLQADLLRVTRQETYPYVFVCGQFIGGSSDLFNMHHSGQLRQVLNNCMSRNG